jgi:hypothetical protein
MLVGGSEGSFVPLRRWRRRRLEVKPSHLTLRETPNRLGIAPSLCCSAFGTDYYSITSSG